MEDAREEEIRALRARISELEEVALDPLMLRLFEPFFSTKPPHRGSGLGLANALRRVQQASGTLECTSSTGKGSTFEIRLPELDAPIPPKPAAQDPDRGRGELILVVDDEPLVRTTLRRTSR